MTHKAEKQRELTHCDTEKELYELCSPVSNAMQQKGCETGDECTKGKKKQKPLDVIS